MFPLFSSQDVANIEGYKQWVFACLVRFLFSLVSSGRYYMFVPSLKCLGQFEVRIVYILSEIKIYHMVRTFYSKVIKEQQITF